MGIIRMDFRFTSIYYELMALNLYIDLIEEQLPLLQSSNRERILDEYKERNNEDNHFELLAAFKKVDEMDERILPRLLLAPIIISLWGVFESGIEEIADYIRQQRSEDLKLKDIRGNLLERTKKYFRSVINYKLNIDDENWQRLRIISKVRNVFTHANGRASAINEKDIGSIRQIVKKEDGLEWDDELIIPSILFVRDCHMIVCTILTDLMNRVKLEYD